MRSTVPRIRTVSCAEAGRTIDTEMKLAAASTRRDTRDMFALPELTACGSVVGTKTASPRHFAALPLQPRGLAYIPGTVRARSPASGIVGAASDVLTNEDRRTTGWRVRFGRKSAFTDRLRRKKPWVVETYSRWARRSQA